MLTSSIVLGSFSWLCWKQCIYEHAPLGLVVSAWQIRASMQRDTCTHAQTLLASSAAGISVQGALFCTRPRIFTSRHAHWHGRQNQHLARMCRHFAPALVLSLLDTKLSWDEAEMQASSQQGVEVIKADGSPLLPYDLKRLQARCPLQSCLPWRLRPLKCRGEGVQMKEGFGPSGVISSDESLPLLYPCAHDVLAEAQQAVREGPANDFSSQDMLKHSLQGGGSAWHLQDLPDAAQHDIGKSRAVKVLVPCVQAIQASMKAALNPEDLAELAIQGQEMELEEATGKSAPAAGALVSVKASGAGLKAGQQKKGAAEASMYKKKQGKRDAGKSSKQMPGKKQKR